MKYTEEDLKQIAEQNRKRFLAAQPANKLDIEMLTDSIAKLNDNIAQLSQALKAQAHAIGQLPSKKGK